MTNTPNNNQNLLDGYAKINYGKSKFYYQEFVISNAAFPASCQAMMLGDYSFTQLIIHATAGTKIEYSFDGYNVAGWVQVSTVREIRTISNPIFRKIWFRAASGSSVNVELY